MRYQTAAPSGFEDLDDAVDTVFDVSVLGRRIGAFRAVMSGGTLRFTDPETLATALEGVIQPDAARAMLSQPLPLNEQYRCFPGQTIGCGLLPPGMTGAIVDPQRFAVELFFAPQDVIMAAREATILGPSSSVGPTLVQNVGLSFASADFSGSDIEYGGALETYASVGRSAFIAQTLVSSATGTRLNQGLVQHVWDDRVARGGLIEDFGGTLLTNYRMVGASYGSFIAPGAYEDGLAGTPLEVVLPRDADVELRRNGVLLSVRRYAAGPQRLDTTSLPNGSYPVEIVARADGAVVFEEIRSFSKAGGLPPPGRTEFTVGAGLFVPDRLQGLTLEDEPFLPQVQEDMPIVSMRAARRIASTTAAEVALLAVDGELYGEASLRSFFARFEGVAAVAAGGDGDYGVTVTGTAVWRDARLTIGARSVHTDRPTDFGSAAQQTDYRPFLRSEDSLLASLQFPLAGGSFSLSGNYTQVEGFEDRYSVGARYSRALQTFGRRAFLNAYAQHTDRDSRVGFTLSFGFGGGQSLTGSAAAGAEYVSGDDGGVRSGLSPVARLELARRDVWRGADITSLAGASTSADNDRLYAGVNVLSNWGAGDLTVQHVRSSGGDFSSVYGNVQTGFAVGGGATKFGMAQMGQAVIISEVPVDAPDTSSVDDGSGYRVRIDSQPFDLLRPGARSAVGVAAYETYEVSLTPENAPPFDADLTMRRITLYPGNVVRERFEATREFTLFGQLIGPDGEPMGDTMIRTGADLTTTDAYGYFTLTGRADAVIEVRPREGLSCAPVPVGPFVEGRETQPFHRIGRLRCEATQP